MEYGAASGRVDLRLLRLFCLLPSKSEFVVFKYFNDIVLVLRLFVAIHAQPRALRKYFFSFVIPYPLPLSLLLHLLNCILTTIGRLTVFPILAASLLACLPMALLFFLVQISKDTAVLFNVLKYFRDIICGFTSR